MTVIQDTHLNWQGHCTLEEKDYHDLEAIALMFGKLVGSTSRLRVYGIHDLWHD